MHTLSDLQAGRLTGLHHIKIAEGLSQFPRELFTLSDTLEILDLSGNNLSELPDDFAKLHNLRILFLSNNQFESVPDVLSRCNKLTMLGFKSNRISLISTLPKQIRWLILTDNLLTQLPEDFGNYQQLEKLMLAGNQLTSLPKSMAQCRHLALIRLAANQLAAIPEWLFGLPKLAWLALAGNPCTTKQTSTIDLPSINANELIFEAELGQGASGVISRAKWQDQYIAVKIFKGHVTSDGYPKDEMNAAINAGQHPNLVTPIAKLNHPQQTGLIFKLIDPDYRNLAAPPSFASCTRDVYTEQIQFDARAALKLLQQIASAAKHLHQHQLLHGDLYAHNILINAQHDCLLGDFGATSCYQNNRASLFERIEVLAFAHLLEEVMLRSPITKPLQALHQQCSQPDIQQRPSFLEIERYLHSISIAS